MFDTHCHLDFLDFSIPEILHTAHKEYGLLACISIGLRHDTFESMYDLTKNLQNIWYTAGNHPSEEFDSEPSSESLDKFARFERVVAIGETGLDFYYDNVAKEVQRKRFERQIALAQEVDKPLVIHCRDALSDVLSMLKYHKSKFVMHCFTGNAAEAELCLDIGAMISFSGIVTFKNAVANQEAALITPIDRMFVETDSPYLTPVPFRGKPNHPGMVKHVAQKIADLKQMPLHELVEITTNNACDFFKVKLSEEPFSPAI